MNYILGLEKFIVTSSRDGADAFGCADHALGWGSVAEEIWPQDDAPDEADD